jgi:hypothetical protein
LRFNIKRIIQTLNLKQKNLNLFYLKKIKSKKMAKSIALMLLVTLFISATFADEKISKKDFELKP